MTHDDGHFIPGPADLAAWRQAGVCNCGRPETCPFRAPAVAGGSETVHAALAVVLSWLVVAAIVGVALVCSLVGAL